MKRTPRWLSSLSALGILVLLALPLPSAAARASASSPSRVLVKFAPGAQAEQIRSAISSAGGASARSFRRPGPDKPGSTMDRWRVVTLASGISVPSFLMAIAANPLVVSAHRDYTVSASGQTFPNDLFFPVQYALHNTGQSSGTPDADIDAPEAWSRTTGSENVVIAISDSGALLAHPDLAPNLWENPGEIAGNGVDDDGNGFVDDFHGYDFLEDDPTPSDESITELLLRGAR